MWVKNRVAGCAIAYEGAPMPVFENLQPPQLPPGGQGAGIAVSWCALGRNCRFCYVVLLDSPGQRIAAP